MRLTFEKLGARHELREALEHPAGADRGKLRGVADYHELRPAIGDQLGQAIEARGVRHPGLVEEDRRALA